MTNKDDAHNGVHSQSTSNAKMASFKSYFVSGRFNAEYYSVLSRRSRETTSIIRETEMRVARKAATARSYKPLPRSFSHDLDMSECRI